jgi:hypothetical protein
MSKGAWAVIGAVASILGIIGFGMQLRDTLDKSAEKRQKFDAIFESALRADQAQFMSSHNSTIELRAWLERKLEAPASVSLPEGLNFARIWNKHGSYLNSFWGDLARCLEAKECAPGASARTICPQVKVEDENMLFIAENILRIEQVGLNQLAGEPIQTPNLMNIRTVRNYACEK